MTFARMTRRQMIVAAAAAAMPLPARALSEMPEGWVLPEIYQPRRVRFRDEMPAGAIIVDPDLLQLYHVTDRQSGILNTVGVGRGGLYEDGNFTVGAKTEWRN